MARKRAAKRQIGETQSAEAASDDVATGGAAGGEPAAVGSAYSGRDTNAN